jgi:hypothetical protein
VKQSLRCCHLCAKVAVRSKHTKKPCKVESWWWNESG